MSQKANNRPNGTQTKPESKQTVSVYTVEEFAAAPDVVGAKSVDIVRAALTTGNKASYTIEEAKTIIKDFAKKEVN